MKQVLFLIVFFCAYTIQGITGFAGNILAMPPGIALLGMSDSVTVLNTTGITGCGMLAVKQRKNIDWQQFFRVIGVLLVFLFVGIWIDHILSLHALLIIYGALIVAIGIRNLAAKRMLHVPEWVLWLAVVGAGLVQGMFVSGGGLLVIWATHKLRDRDSFRGTLSLIWVVLNFAYVIERIVEHAFTPENLVLIAFAIPLSFLATVVGDRLQGHLGTKTFMRFTYILLICVGGITLVSALV
jgi:uncharacterized membrane protein YfcA